MRPFVSVVMALAMLLSPLVLPVRAQQEAPAWQVSITGQIEAFRHMDAAGAFSYAGAAFQVSFPTPEAFFLTIVGSGYAAIMESQSHSFGSFRMVDDTSVLQAVTLVGKDQSLYEAIYQLTEEPAGWRVQGVQLTKLDGMGV